jgi:hypothetical protein
MTVGLRPYYAENTGSHPNPEVKLHQAELVLGWGTTLEPSVLQAFLLFSLCFLKITTRSDRCKGCLIRILLDPIRPIGAKGDLILKVLSAIGAKGDLILKVLRPIGTKRVVL